MGTSTFATRGRSIGEILAEEMAPYQIVERSSSGSANYVAARDPKDGLVSCWVVLVNRTSFHGEPGVSVKVMHETMGPYYYAPAAKVLAALDPPMDDTAAEWRAKASAAKASPLASGDRIRFNAPLNYGKYGEFSEFSVVRDGRKTYFHPIAEGVAADFLVRITHFAARTDDYVRVGS